MRLTCPKCGAEYEVPKEVIPDTGRDVQCSNCGNTWFQEHPDFAASATPEVQETVDPDPLPEAPIDADEIDAEIEELLNQPEETPAAPPKRELDKSIVNILREEANLEQESRKREAQAGLETQTDLGLTQPEKPQVSDDEPTAADAQAEPAEQAKTEDSLDIDETHEEDANRRDLLPDIEEINSSFNGDDRSGVDGTDTPDIGLKSSPEKSRFGSGFLLVVALFILAAAVYLGAPMLAEQVPSLEGPLGSYTEAVDGGRAQLNIWISDAVVWFETMSAPVEKE